MGELDWHGEGLTARFSTPDDGPVRLVDLVRQSPGHGARPDRAGQPLVEVLTTQYGMRGQDGRHSGTTLGHALRHVEHHESASGARRELIIVQADPDSGLRAESRLAMIDGVAAITGTTRLSLDPGHAPLTVTAVSSIATGAIVSDDPGAIDVWSADTTWAAENRWHAQPLQARSLGRVAPGSSGETIAGRVGRTSLGTRSSGTTNPAGAATHRGSGRTLAWQIEHSGGWTFEVGERRGGAAYVALLGPTDLAHQWSIRLTGDTTFTTVAATIAVGDSLDDALGELTRYRRLARRPHPQNTTLPVIFNDYMNTMSGDPSEAKLLPLIDAAAAVGADCFCIDAGWYDDTSGWWASVGDWQPSTVRFPRGLAAVLDHIRDQGMTPGLWLEPEVVGVTSEAATTLPADAFFQRGGDRVRNKDRYLLDLRHPASREHLDQTVDRLVGELGVGMFKLDYNVTPGAGTDSGPGSVGQQLLEHNRAHLDWLDGVLDRHPELIIESCASGGMRTDFAVLSRLALQSTSDQTEPLLYPAIAVGALAHILPEQAGNWSYPQADMSDEQIVFTMCTGLAGRLYQSGWLDRMSPNQLALVADGVRVHKQTVRTLARSVPRFPTGLPNWDDAWISVAFDAGDETLLLAWRQEHADDSVELAVPHLGDAEVTVEQIYPDPEQLGGWTVERTPVGLRVTAADPQPAARMWRITS